MIVKITIELDEPDGAETWSMRKAISLDIDRTEYMSILRKLVREMVDGAYRQQLRTGGSP
jgi:Arc/MetJ family transcription regulator